MSQERPVISFHVPSIQCVDFWLFNGTDIYLISSEPENVPAPKPTLSSLMLKLIHRVRALK